MRDMHKTSTTPRKKETNTPCTHKTHTGGSGKAANTTPLEKPVEQDTPATHARWALRLRTRREAWHAWQREHDIRTGAGI